MDMTRRRTSCMVAVVIAIALCSISAYAGGFGLPEGIPHDGMDLKRHPMSPFGIWNDPQLVTELGLTDEQLKGLRDADFTFRDRLLELRAQMDRLHLQMTKSFTSETLEDEAVRGVAKKIADLMGKMFTYDIEARMAMEKLLTTEQRKKLRALELRQGPHGRANPEGPSPRMGRHP
jgi:Spy/CpxP family protein refolding chaperone